MKIREEKAQAFSQTNIKTKSERYIMRTILGAFWEIIDEKFKLKKKVMHKNSKFGRVSRGTMGIEGMMDTQGDWYVLE